MSGEPSTIKRDLASLEDIASAYVARLANGADAAERREIEAWIDADPHHAVVFARLESAWEAAERLRAAPPAMDKAPVDSPRAGAWPGRRGVLGALAAACAVGGVLTGAWLHARDLKLYRTGVGERRTVVLDDGSSVELNTASTIEVAMHRHRRDVRLVQGEALFEVAHDASRPFWVTAGEARFRAVGTAFNVRIRNQVVELTVTQGVVAVSAAGKADRPGPHIAAGGGAVVDGQAIAATILGDDTLRQRTAWQQGVLEFNGETLAQAVDELNRYQRQPIVIGDQRIADIRVGGRFQVNEADKFLTAVSSAFPVDVQRTGDGGVLLTGRDEKSSDPG